MDISEMNRRRRTIQTSTLRSVHRERMLNGLQQLHFPEGPKAELERFLRESQEWFARTAPSEIREMIWTWRRNPDRPGVLMIDGFGVDPDLPPTPIDGRRSAAKLTTYSEQVLAGVATLIGEPISFASERNGTLFTDLSPVKGKENALTNEGSEAELGWHTEHAASAYLLDPPQRVVDCLTFFHLRGDPRGEAKTLVADIRDAIRLMEPDMIAALRRPEFIARLPMLVRSSLPANRHAFANHRILTGSDEHPFVSGALYGDLLEGTTPEAIEALAALKRALDAVQMQVPTVPGRLVILDNRRVLHGRYPFKPAYDGNDRWLQRCMTTSSLEPFRAWQRHQSPRVLTPF